MTDLQNSLRRCTVCPRKCGADRTKTPGFCGADAQIEVSKVMLHHWEEPCISGTEKERGSGAVFFTHCPLGCIYCQNREISGRDARGTRLSEEQLADTFLRLQEQGAYNVNLVSPTHYAVQLIRAVELARRRGLTLPVVWNTGGYERAETIEALRGTADIFLTDVKYYSSALSDEFSKAPDYWSFCAPALSAMHKIAGKPEYSSDGMMKRGVIVRHLVLPGCRTDSIEILRRIAALLPVGETVLSLMRQYTPDFFTLPDAPSPRMKKLTRRVASFEYNSVVKEAVRLGFDGYTQEKDSASRRYTPTF